MLGKVDHVDAVSIMVSGPRGSPFWITSRTVWTPLLGRLRVSGSSSNQLPFTHCLHVVCDWIWRAWADPLCSLLVVHHI